MCFNKLNSIWFAVYNSIRIRICIRIIINIRISISSMHQIQANTTARCDFLSNHYNRKRIKSARMIVILSNRRRTIIRPITGRDRVPSLPLPELAMMMMHPVPVLLWQHQQAATKLFDLFVRPEWPECADRVCCVACGWACVVIMIRVVADARRMRRIFEEDIVWPSSLPYHRICVPEKATTIGSF